jgi:hypothetical protein
MTQAKGVLLDDAFPAIPGMHHRQARQQIIFTCRRVAVEPMSTALGIHQEIRSHQQRDIRHLGERPRGEALGVSVGGLVTTRWTQAAGIFGAEGYSMMLQPGSP